MISDKEMNDKIKIVQALEDSDISRKGVTETIKNKTKKQEKSICLKIGTYWIALFCNRNEIVYFDGFGVEHVPEEIKEFIRNKNIKANIFRVQVNDSNVGTFALDSLILC